MIIKQVFYKGLLHRQKFRVLKFSGRYWSGILTDCIFTRISSMEQKDFKVFSLLYREAYSRCFGLSLAQPLTETEGKLFERQLLDTTGLVIGWRNLKNYSILILDENKRENPPVSSMDTLARYVLKAPYTNEIERKKNESHHPYWYLYRERHLARAVEPEIKPAKLKWIAPVLAGILLFFVAYTLLKPNKKVSFTENFSNLSDSDLQERDWQLLNKDDEYWQQRHINPNALTLFTLPGDNWLDSTNKPEIKNLLVRLLPEGCFSTELHIEDFIPGGQWQQAGLLFLEDTSLNSASIRISLAFNNFFGGFDKPAEILIQGMATPGRGGKPEEFIHHRVMTLDSSWRNPLVHNNLKQTALRIERQGTKYRLLYAGGAAANSAFRELAVKELPIKAKYVGIFALKGRVPATPVAPVKIKKFLLETVACE